MVSLVTIKDTVMQVAEAITAVLGIETEIVDDKLLIIGGTGRYKEKIGTYEENGDLDSGYAYANILKTGKNDVCVNPLDDPEYMPVENELAKIACPIIWSEKIVGLIGLVAFDKEQKGKLESQSESLLLFLNKMANLIASKMDLVHSSNSLEYILESMGEGLIAMDQDFQIVSCNAMCENLVGKSRKQMVGRYLCNFFDARKRMFDMTMIEPGTSFDHIIGVNKAILALKKRAFHVASSDSTILITGESGTGKGIFARAIHSASQRQRRENSFVVVNCGAIPETLLESELFGYEQGAFTGANAAGKPGKFEMADKGTIFLDEIGDLPIHLQVKLLHVLQNKVIERIGGTKTIHVDVRIIAATNKNLEEMIEKKEFREDLYFRLNVIPIYIPPLRERRDDIEEILNMSLKKFNAIMGKEIMGFSKDAMELLLRHDWPGNVRELENVVEYAVNMETNDFVEVQNLPEKLQNCFAGHPFGKMNLKDKMDEYQRKLIKECLDRIGYSLEAKQKVADILGISESTLYRRIRELKIKEK